MLWLNNANITVLYIAGISYQPRVFLVMSRIQGQLDRQIDRQKGYQAGSHPGFPKNTTQCPQPGLEPRPLTRTPLCLPQIARQMNFIIVSKTSSQSGGRLIWDTLNKITNKLSYVTIKVYISIHCCIYMVKSAGQNHPQGRSICPVPRMRMSEP